MGVWGPWAPCWREVVVTFGTVAKIVTPHCAGMSAAPFLEALGKVRDAEAGAQLRRDAALELRGFAAEALLAAGPARPSRA